MSVPDPEPARTGRRLDSWKEIAAYLGRSERTVRRWEEHEGLPVHRLQHQERGSVYAFTGELDAWRASRASVLEESHTAPAEAVPRPQAAPQSSTRWPMVLAAAVLVGVIAVGGWWARAAKTPTPRFMQSLAVLPFDNLSGDAAQEYLADGLTEELITDLAQISQLRVISRTSVMRFKGPRPPLPDIARQLNVDGVVEGSVTRSGSRVRATVQLIDGRSDRHLWSKSYERDVADVIALQADVARAITSEIYGFVPTAAATTSAPLRTPDSGEAYLQGLYHINKGTQEEIQKGIAVLTGAVERNPRDARSEAAIANAYLWLSDYYLPPSMMLPQAKEAALKAVSIDDSIAESHTALGAVSFLYDWDWSAAEREFRRGIALNPGSADAHIWYAMYLVQAERVPQAIEEVERAESLDPLSLPLRGEAGWVFFLARQEARARAEWRKILDLEPQFAFSHTTIWAAYLGGDDFMRSRLAARVPADADAVDLAARIGARAAAKETAAADALIAELKRRSSHEYFCPYEMATAGAMLGRNDEAFAWLDKAVAERSTCVPSIKADPRLSSLHADSRFAALLRAGQFPR